MQAYAQAHEEHWTQERPTVKKNAYTKINSCTALQNNSNSNEFTGFDMKKVNILT